MNPLKLIFNERYGNQYRFKRGNVVHFFYSKILPQIEHYEQPIRRVRMEEIGVVAERIDSEAGKPEYYLIVSRDKKVTYARANEIWGVPNYES